MRRLDYLLAVIAVILVGSLIYTHLREDRWRPLPGGGEIRLLKVTYEKNPHVSTRGAFSQALFAGLGSRWPVALGSPPLSLNPSYSRPCLAFWLTTRNAAPQKLFVDKNFLLVAGDQQLRSLQTLVQNNPEDHNKLVLAAVDFAFVPHTVPRLRMRMLRITDDQSVDFEVPNPCYDPNFPEWKAEPLPQTRTAGNLEITLRDFQLKDRKRLITRNGGFKYYFVPEFIFRLSGDPREKGFAYRHTITNSYGETIKDWGGYSHPVWKVECKVSPAGLMPDEDPNALTVEFFVKPPPLPPRP